MTARWRIGVSEMESRFVFETKDRQAAVIMKTSRFSLLSSKPTGFHDYCLSLLVSGNLSTLLIAERFVSTQGICFAIISQSLVKLNNKGVTR